ncbi:MAG: HDIG domain-containing protein [Anaerolineae bacterium]|nr:HDIG domain-containing protein [Anaerolineae bacterium]NUQ03587.1 HDIG domain-containing protein [Anaerolineae bacterium]
MLSRFSDFIDSLAPSTTLRRETPLHRVTLALVGFCFVVGATLCVAFDAVFPTGQALSSLGLGSVVEEDVRAPFSIEYVSEVLTEQRRSAAANAVTPIYDPPDPTIARQQATLLQQILDFIDNIRRDPYGSAEQKQSDLLAITALRLDPVMVTDILLLDDETWRATGSEAINVLERVMREPIRELDLATVLEQLPSQVALRFDQRTASVVVALVKDVLRPNRFVNLQATETARQAAVDSIQPETRSFERGQVVVRAGTRLDAVDDEALRRLGLFDSEDRRVQLVLRAFIGSLLAMVLIGLYLARFPDGAYLRARFVALLCFVFLVGLFSARLFLGVQPPYYIYPAAGLALLLVVISKPEIAMIATVAQGILIGLMAENSLEVATLVISGGMVGSLILRRTERLNSYFVISIFIAVTNVVVVTLFNLELLSSSVAPTLGLLLLYALVNGVLSAMVALVGMYVLTFVLNLPTSFKLVELSQPNHPLLQRVLREAPGTYQHSLQVANLCEQAANAIGASADLTRVAALYHDIGKMLNPAFFVENQVDNLNPHDALNDPYRSASIIISHVIEGEKLARQYRLPVRIRDFILEHHGTTKVGYFYNRAVEQAGDTEAVDIDQFTYPGPKPQSRETAIMMLADNCESTVRARKPTNKQEIAEIVSGIFDQRMREGQLDEANLTLRDLDTARTIFVEMLQAVFHPRINYPIAPTAKRASLERVPIGDAQLEAAPRPRSGPSSRAAEQDVPEAAAVEPTPPLPKLTAEMKAITIPDDDEDAPLQVVPPLRRTQKVSVVEVGDDDTRSDSSDINKGDKP